MHKNAHGVFDAHLSAEALEAHARDLAALPVRGASRVKPLKMEMAALKRAFQFIAACAKAGEELEPAAAWILDNFPFLEEALQSADEECRHLPPLPALLSGELRAVALVREAVAHTDALVDGEALALCAKGYLMLRGLRMAELWALPRLLRVALMRAAVEVARQAAQNQADRRRADALVDELNQGKPMRLTEADLKCPAILERISARLREESGSIIEELDRQMLRLGIDRGKMIAGAHHNSSILQLRISNAIRSLRMVQSLDWTPYFESLSPVETLLRGERSGVYPGMDADSREMLRRQVERFAHGHRVSEEQVARTARLLADVGSGREAHVGYYLYGPGKDELSERLGPRRRGFAAHRFIDRHAKGLYMGAVFLLSWVIPLAILPWQGPLVALLSNLPATSLAIRWVGFLARKLFPPRRLLKMDYSDALPEDARTLVVIPCLLTSAKQAREQARQLETLYLSNRGENIGYALLSDLRDHDQPERSDDGEILQAVAEEIQALRQKYGPRFGLYHRRRTWHEGQGRHMGRERKRGALEDLNRYLLKGEQSPFAQMLPVEMDRQSPFVLTLDADTILPPGAVRCMAGALAHPLNRPGPDGGGYAVLAPRMESLPDEGMTRFQKVYSSLLGIDLYSSASSEVYQDLCGEGIFSGKGIYDVRAFHDALEGKIPDNAVLSHDLLEGCFAGAALCSDVVFFDSQPRTLSSWMGRLHRWVRGDWQLIPFLFRRDLRPLDKWKMADNLRRSLTAGATLLCILFGSPLFALLAALMCFGTPLRKRDFLPFLCKLCFLPYEACMQADAALRALYRTFISHKHMLDWVTAADAERKKDGNRWHTMFPQAVFGVLSLASASPWFAALWLPGAALAKYLEGPAHPRESLEDEEREFLMDVARRTFAWFESVGPADNYLPPDNIQVDPYRGPARRTSPTNIGLALTAYAAAMDLGLLSPADMLRRMERTLSSIERLEKWKGHLYNWYATDTLRPLQPLYVSSVDGGNLAACLWAAAAAARECGLPEGESVAIRCEQLVEDMDFSLLYDSARRQFFIGYDAQSGQMGGAHYDLLASESRLMSYIAIAKGDVPARHFASTGRPLTRVGDQPCLLSWSGTMFEYLMPCLFLKDQPGTLLHTSAKGVVEAQRLAATDRPWGESESGYYAFDLSLNYQYKAFGIPNLSMKGGLPGEQVVAPYATALALLVEPQAACYNLMRLADMGALGPTGFYEAIDYTPERVGGAQEGYRLIRSTMAHHQGMSLLALEGALGGRFIQRFMRIPSVKAHAVLLTERTPTRYAPARLRPARSAQRTPWLEKPIARSAGQGEMHLLSAGESSLALDAQGRGIWKHGALAVTRFRRGQEGPYGPTLYLRDLATDEIARIAMYGRFEGGQAVYFARLSGVEARLTIALSPEDGALVQKLDLTNRTDASRRLEATAYLEPVLMRQEADVAHRAYGDLFLEARDIPDGVLVRRRPRAREQDRPMLAFVCGGDGVYQGREWKRMRFIGRGGDLYQPAGLRLPFSRGNGERFGAPIEPCAALRRRVELPPGGDARLHFCAVFGRNDEEKTLAAIAAYSTADGVRHAFTMASMRAQVELGYLKLDAHQLCLMERAAYALLEEAPRSALQKEAAARNRLAQSDLWRFGISGDRPIVLLSLSQPAHIPLARQAISAHEYWQRKGGAADLVFINDHGNDYLQPVRDKLDDLIRAGHLRGQVDAPGGVYRINGQQISAAERDLLYSRASLLLIGGQGDWEEQLPPPPPPPVEPIERTAARPVQLQPVDLRFSNPYGGFAKDGREYVITHTPPTPWSNVMANPRFGALVTDRMGGYTWVNNSREQKITPWCNDPVSDWQGEGIRLYDELSGAQAPLSLRCRHGQGYSVFEGGLADLPTECTVFVDPEQSVKCTTVRIQNQANSERTLRLEAFAQWVLAPDGEERHLGVSVERRGDLLSARNGYASPIGVAFLRLEGAACMDDETLSLSLTLSAGETAELHILLGHAEDTAAAESLCAGFHPASSLRQAKDFWDEWLGRVQVRTPDEGVNYLLNRWLPYQSLSSRFYGRTAFYQAGGAWGFRDQLQDAAMLALYDPSILREQILRCAAHQFEEGDVQHWWHDPRRGVRTRIRDDLLFLPWAVARYVEITGDVSILEESVPFLSAPLLSDGQEDAYLTPDIGPEATIRAHCMAALREGCRMGEHGLPLIGGGDWNDAMNRVGLEGKGESVWLGWFLCDTLKRFAPLCTQEDGQALLHAREMLLQAIETHGWDGEWYRRAFFDDGTPMGTKGAAHCEIDLIAQAWSALAGGRKERAQQAMESALIHLLNEDAGILRLLTPPFDTDGPNVGPMPNAGYIAGYLPGVRENGGQYTHGAAWAVLADCALGNHARAERVLRHLLPHAKDPDRYQVEPYVAAADVYDGEHAGRGGWTWYTGSAAWLWRAAVEGLCGLRVQAGHAQRVPALAGWPMEMRYHGKDVPLCSDAEAVQAHPSYQE